MSAGGSGEPDGKTWKGWAGTKLCRVVRRAVEGLRVR